MSNLAEFLNTPLKDIVALRRGAKNGDLFGVELECEGKSVGAGGLTHEIAAHWEPKEDGSLRNNHGQSMEWIFKGPVDLETSKERIELLFKFFGAKKARLVPSNRTSTHVHFNMSDKRMYQVANLYILFTILDDILDTYCGEDRKGNLFCLSSRYAEEQIRWIRECFEERQNIVLNDNMRYTSLNIASLTKFGSVEFRGMRGLDNADDIIDWLDIINDLCQYACYSMKNPANLIEEISVERPINFLKKIFSEKSFNNLTRGLNEHQINASIYDGLRIIQPFSYRIGEEFHLVKIVGKDFWAEQEKPKKRKPIKADWENLDFVDIEQVEAPVAPRPLRVNRAGRAGDPIWQFDDAQFIVRN